MKNSKRQGTTSMVIPCLLLLLSRGLVLAEKIGSGFDGAGFIQLFFQAVYKYLD